MRGRLDRSYPLRREADADESRPLPYGAKAPERERAIVIARAHPEAHPAGIEADERQKHQIERADSRHLRACRLEYAQRIRAHRTGGSNELHSAAAPVTEPRHEDAATVPADQRSEGSDVELFGQGAVKRDPLARMQ